MLSAAAAQTKRGRGPDPLQARLNADGFKDADDFSTQLIGAVRALATVKILAQVESMGKKDEMSKKVLLNAASQPVNASKLAYVDLKLAYENWDTIGKISLKP